MCAPSSRNKFKRRSLQDALRSLLRPSNVRIDELLLQHVGLRKSEITGLFEKIAELEAVIVKLSFLYNESVSRNGRAILTD